MLIFQRVSLSKSIKRIPISSLSQIKHSKVGTNKILLRGKLSPHFRCEYTVHFARLLSFFHPRGPQLCSRATGSVGCSGCPGFSQRAITLNNQGHVEDHNMPPQNTPLWHKDDFELAILRNCRHRRSFGSRAEVTLPKEMHISKGNLHL
jgi:hypothetical protein